MKTEPEIDVVNSDDDAMTQSERDVSVRAEGADELEKGEIVEANFKTDVLSLKQESPASPPEVKKPRYSSSDDDVTPASPVANPFSIDRLLCAKRDVTSPQQPPARNWRHVTSAATGAHKLNQVFPFGMLPLFPTAHGQALPLQHPTHALAWLHMQERLNAMLRLTRRPDDD